MTTSEYTSGVQVGNGLRAVGAMYVRDPHGMGLSSHPADKTPEGIDCTVEDLVPPSLEGMTTTQAARVFTYTVAGSDQVKIRHVFTCNRPGLQAIPNELFRAFQLEVPLAWQEAKTRLAAGEFTAKSYTTDLY